MARRLLVFWVAFSLMFWSSLAPGTTVLCNLKVDLWEYRTSDGAWHLFVVEDAGAGDGLMWGPDITGWRLAGTGEAVSCECYDRGL